MKKLLIVLCIAVVFGFTTVDSPVPVSIYSGYIITSAGTTEVELQFADLTTSNPTKTLVYIQLASDNSGTVQFSVGRAIDASYQPYAAGVKIPISIQNGVKNLRYKASASNQKFSLTH